MKQARIEHASIGRLLRIQVLAFQKSWRSFSPITVCLLAQCQCRTGVGGGGGGLGFLKTNRALNDIVSIYGNVLVEVWGCFEGVKCVLG